MDGDSKPRRPVSMSAQARFSSFIVTGVALVVVLLAFSGASRSFRDSRRPSAVVVPAPSGHFHALATRSDAIRPIYHPRFVQASGTGLFPGDLVIGVAIGDAARAYPVAYLTEREMVDDRIGHTPFVVTWCPVCYSAVVFDRRIGRRTYVFGNNSRLYMRNLTMWDHQTGSI